MRRSSIIILSLVISVLTFSCRATKFVPEDEYLLDNYKIENTNKDVEKSDLKSYIKQKPNKRIFYWKFYLSLYNLSKKDKDNGFNNWLRKIGEPPVVYDDDLKDKSTEQLNLYLQSKGYYNAVVNDTTKFKRRRAVVHYNIETGQPYLIRNIDYFFHDANLSKFIFSDSAASNLKKGALFDMDKLQAERVRIEKLLRNNGYFGFTREFIYYEVDSSLNSFQVDVTLGIRNFPLMDEYGKVKHIDHPVYHINDVYFVGDYRSYGGKGSANMDSMKVDTAMYDNLYVINPKKPNLKAEVVTQKNYIIPGELYSAENSIRTYRDLSSLSAFKMVDISFREAMGEDNLLDAEIRIVPATKQSYTVEIEGTNSGGNIGAAGNLNYQHRNLFGGSERFDLTFLGAIEALRENTGGGHGNMVEFGVEARISFPKFILPFKTVQFTKKYNPKTNLSAALNFQRRPDYTRTVANASFGYNWRATNEITHNVYPIEASLILTPYQSEEFKDWLDGKYLYYSYQPHFILDQRYSFIFSNQNYNKEQDFQYLRIDAETAGNLLYAGYSLLGTKPDSGNYQIFNVDFAQYVKGGIEFRNYTYLYEGISFITRGYIGAGIPYLNSNAMPFIKQFYSGGANSIRAWQLKNLGPGSYVDTVDTGYPNQTADLKLEFNLEYRFKLFWKLESAFFLDIGNIWSLSSEDDREGAQFKFNTFYKELAVGTGIGARFDFNFFIFRFDLGIPLRNPYPIEGSNWLLGNAGINGRDLTFNLAIGYPF